MNQMMVATKSERIFRIRWDGVEERDFSLDLKRIPFSINQQVSYGMCACTDSIYVNICFFYFILVTNSRARTLRFDTHFLLITLFATQYLFLLFFISAVPILESNTYVSSMEYSPLIGGFAITLNDGRAAYLTANSLKFDPNVRKTNHFYLNFFSTF